MTFYDTNGINNTQANPIWVVPSGVNATPIDGGVTTDTVIKASGGVYFGILVTGSGAGVPRVYDNDTEASGTIVGQLGSTPPVQGVQCAAGITIAGGSTNPPMTVFWT